MGIDNERTGLVNEIFQLTGQKVEIHDPIVLAALIHSRMIRRAGQDAKKMIQSPMGKVLMDLTEDVKLERLAGADISRATAQAYGEVPQLQAQIGVIAQQILKHVQEESKARYSSQWPTKLWFCMLFVFFLGCFAGNGRRIF